MGRRRCIVEICDGLELSVPNEPKQKCATGRNVAITELQIVLCALQGTLKAKTHSDRRGAARSFPINITRQCALRPCALGLQSLPARL